METKPVIERMEFVMRVESGLYTMAESCRRSGISRKTGHKIWNRFLLEGVDGLRDRSRRPHRSPTRTPEEIEDSIVDIRMDHPDWGPKKLTRILRSLFPDEELPAKSTIAAILKRRELVEKPKRRRIHTHPGKPFIEAAYPNDLWTTDFKGEFKTGDGVYCYPLTVADQVARYILACEGLLSTRTAGVRPVFEKLFRKRGLPNGILSDNGSPFASRSIHGLTALNVWWMQLGIRHFRIEPGKPQQNGRHERMHRTLKAKTARPPAHDLPGQQIMFDEFRHEFNEIRPHEALDQETPASVWSPSKRQMPDKIPPPEYPGYFVIRTVCSAGTFRFKGERIFVSQALAHQPIGLEEIDDGVWSIYFYDTLLARVDERNWKVIE
jgi:transposase InsO family protein